MFRCVRQRSLLSSVSRIEHQRINFVNRSAFATVPYVVLPRIVRDFSARSSSSSLLSSTTAMTMTGFRSLTQRVAFFASSSNNNGSGSSDRRKREKKRRADDDDDDVDGDGDKGNDQQVQKIIVFVLLGIVVFWVLSTQRDEIIRSRLGSNGVNAINNASGTGDIIGSMRSTEGRGSRNNDLASSASSVTTTTGTSTVNQSNTAHHSISSTSASSSLDPSDTSSSTRKESIPFEQTSSTVVNEMDKTMTQHRVLTQLVPTGNVKKIIVRGDVGIVEHKNGSVSLFKIVDAASFERQLRSVEHSINATSAVPVRYESKPFDWFWAFAPTLAVCAFTVYIARQFAKRGGGSNPFGKSKAQVFNKENAVPVRFADVAGLPEAKQEIKEFVEFLQDSKRFEQLGAKIPRGALLVGPPGNGKTLLARAAAGEAGVPFFVTSGSEFLEMFVGVGPARVRDLFKAARKAAPAIIFIDEIDAIGRARGSGQGMSNDERESTLNALLVEMDGFSSTDNVVVLAGTNRADMLDKALLRPGRFDRQISVDNPDAPARREIFLVHLKPLVKDPALNVDDLASRLARLTPTFSGADVANVCNEAALIAARRDAEFVTARDFELAIERVIGGLERKQRVLSLEERRAVAYNEAGKAVAAWFLKHCDPLLKLSIVPRGRRPTGFAQYDAGDQYLLTREQLLDKVCARLAGRAAVELHLGVVTTVSEEDLRYATDIVYNQMSVYGMSNRVGNVSFQGSAQRRLQSNQTSDLIDAEVKALIDNAYDRTKKLLSEHADKVEKLAQLLLEKEIVHGDELTPLLGPRPEGATVLRDDALLSRKVGSSATPPPPPPTPLVPEQQPTPAQ